MMNSENFMSSGIGIVIIRKSCRSYPQLFLLFVYDDFFAVYEVSTIVVVDFYGTDDVNVCSGYIISNEISMRSS